jgi:hypothetical protein
MTSTTHASEAVTYKLFETTNMWTFIKLDTRNGLMWQVQYAINDDAARFQTVLNDIPLFEGWDKENGRFTLYPTKNMYTFILLDQVDGRMWQVQWSTEPKNRGIVDIIK